MTNVQLRLAAKEMQHAAHPALQLSTATKDAQLLRTGAKAYYVGGGHWMVSGYAQSGQDVLDSMIDICKGVYESLPEDSIRRMMIATAMFFVAHQMPKVEHNWRLIAAAHLREGLCGKVVS